MNDIRKGALRLATLAGLALAGLIVAFAATGSASSAAPQATTTTAATAPVATSQPRISGDARDGGTLTTDGGTWRGTQPLTFRFQWLRCDSNGLNCASIGGANTKSYVVSTQDVGHRLRVRVTATNAAGSQTSRSDATSIVTTRPATTAVTTTSSNGRIALGNGAFSRTVESVEPPDRLVVDQVRFSPQPLRSRSVVTARFRVTSVKTGDRVRGAVVYALPLPYGQFRTPPEVVTGIDGWATVQLAPTSSLNLRLGSVQVFVRARKPGDDLLAGISTRRLVQMTLRAG